MAAFSFFKKKLDPKAEQLFDLGQVHLKKGDYKSAADNFKKALAISPGNDSLENALAKAQTLYKESLPQIDTTFNRILQTTKFISQEYLDRFLQKRYLLKTAGYRPEMWALYFVKAEDENTSQVYFYQDNYPGDKISEHWDKGYRIVLSAFDNYKWLVVMETGESVEQFYSTDSEFKHLEILGKINEGLKVENVAYGNGWAIVMNENHDQSFIDIAFIPEDPVDFIKEKWNDDRYITQIAYNPDDDQWMVVSAKHKTYTDQGYTKTEEFPLLDLNNKIQEGQDITSIVGHPNGWFVVYTKNEPELLLQEEPSEETDMETIEEESLEAVLNDLHQLVGMSEVKKEIEQLANFIKLEKLKQERGLKGNPIALHTVFSGNPGTGKTTVARLLGRIFKALGLIKKGHVVEVSRGDLVAEYVGQTAVKTNAVIDSAMDGILFIDEAYALNKGGNDFGSEAMETLLKRMEDERGRFVVIVAGYTQEISDFIDSNPGLKSRFSTYIHFADFNSDELLNILKLMIIKAKHQLEFEAEEKCLRYFQFVEKTKDKYFGNARLARNLFEDLLKVQSNRLAKIPLEQIDDTTLVTLTEEDVFQVVQAEFKDEKEPRFEDIVGELQKLVGLGNIKKDVQELAALIKVQNLQKEKGLEPADISLHSVFYGPPGTGKTTVARLMGRILKSIGLLSRGHVVEVTRMDLVAEYVGQTAIKTNKMLDKAMHGILFIDEAYNLAPEHGGNDFGREALEAILKRMEDDRDKLMVIIAGYTDEINHLLDSNPGLRSRFNRYFYFEDYNSEDLSQIFASFSERTGNIIEAEAMQLVKTFFDEQVAKKNKTFGNARLARNLYEKVIQHRASRISNQEIIDEKDLYTIAAEDVESAITSFSKLDFIKKRIGFKP